MAPLHTGGAALVKCERARYDMVCIAGRWMREFLWYSRGMLPFIVSVKSEKTMR